MSPSSRPAPLSALRTALMLVLLGALQLHCKGGEPVDTTDKPGPDDAYVIVQIGGLGTVHFEPQPVLDCDGTDPLFFTTCDAVLWRGGSGQLTARPAPGWIFEHWTLPMAGLSPGELVVTDPLNPTLVIPQGIEGAVGCIFVRRVSSLQAEFDDTRFTTHYSATIQNPRHDVLTFQWSGPSCGSWGPQLSSTSADAFIDVAMDWTHAHPPCPPSPDHSDTTITLTVQGWSDGRTVTCTYQGALTGFGPDCTER